MSKKDGKKIYKERKANAAERRKRVRAILDNHPPLLSRRVMGQLIRVEMKKRYGFAYPNRPTVSNDISWYLKQQVLPDKDVIAKSSLIKLLTMIDEAHAKKDFNAAIRGLKLLGEWGWVNREAGDHEHFTSELERILGTED